MKKLIAMLLALTLVIALAACGAAPAPAATEAAPAATEAAPAATEAAPADKVITVGFAQVGHESDWRTANTKNYQDVFSAENGYDLMFVDCDNDNAVQIEAVRRCGCPSRT